ncbi:hypothetical protein DOY81_001077 [Sarcophaga bullata]|nr:hypothetical protein DOY81_001077 [Sarcophaga bullata]
MFQGTAYVKMVKDLNYSLQESYSLSQRLLLLRLKELRVFL